MKIDHLQLQPANNTDVIAIPHRSLPDRHAVRQGIAIAQLNLLDHLTGFRVVLEEGVQIGVGAPQPLALPTDSVRAVADCGELEFHDPVFGIETIDGPRRRDGDPEFAVPPLQPVRAGSERPAAQHLSLLESPDGLTLP